jgi:hypothetical protein
MNRKLEVSQQPAGVGAAGLRSFSATFLQSDSISIAPVSSGGSREDAAPVVAPKSRPFANYWRGRSGSSLLCC